MNEVRIDGAINGYDVFLLVVVSRPQDLVDDVTIVREKYEPLAWLIEAADRKNATWIPDVVDDVVWFDSSIGGANDPDRLVECEVHTLLCRGRDQLTIDPNEVSWRDLGSKLRYGPVYRYSALGNEFVGGATRAVAHFTQVLIDPGRRRVRHISVEDNGDQKTESTEAETHLSLCFCSLCPISGGLTTNKNRLHFLRDSPKCHSSVTMYPPVRNIQRNTTYTHSQSQTAARFQPLPLLKESDLSKLSPLHRSLALSFFLAACGGATGTDGDNGVGADGGTGGGGGECVATAQEEISCSDGIDNDCDGKTDCENVSCAFEPNCTGGGGGGSTDGCGEASFGGDPLAIPDGDGVSYETSLPITGFDAGQTLLSADGFVSACVTMEHSWLRDLHIEMICPSGETVVLQQFLGTNGGLLMMGVPNESDEDIFGGPTEPIPGVGYEYCWTANATNEPMLDWANSNSAETSLPAGDYRPSGSMDALVGCTLNGDWSIRATDDWASDNGYIFDWRVTFNENIIPDCDEWID